MKKIKPASFCDETVMNLKGEEFVKTQVNRVAPVDPDSGSGSGNVTGVNGSGRGTIQSQIGGSWNATCDFTWTSNISLDLTFDVSPYFVSPDAINLTLKSCVIS